MSIYKTSQEWIKTSDKLPKDGEMVLIAILQKNSNAPWEYSGCEAFYEDNKWWAVGDHSYITPEYWRPWPTLPFVEDFDLT